MLCQTIRYGTNFCRRIFLLPLEPEYLEMSVNFHLVSLKKFDIQNYLFLTHDRKATQVRRATAPSDPDEQLFPFG